MRECLTAKWLPLLLALLTFSLALLLVITKLEHVFFDELPMERTHIDDYSYLSYSVAKFKTESVPTFIMLGGSVARESTLLDGEFEEYFKKKYGRQIKFRNFAGSNQTVSESLAIANTLPLPKGSVVFVHTTFKKFDLSKESLLEEYFRPRIIGLNYKSHSEFVDLSGRIFRALMPRILLYRGPINYFIEMRKCKWLELISLDSECYRPEKVTRHRYSSVMSLAEKESYVKNLRQYLEKFREHYLFNMQIYIKLHDILQARGVETVFVDYPTAPSEKHLDMEARSATEYPQVTKQLSNLSIYLNWVNKPGYLEDDFRDSQHMLDSGKRKFSASLAEFIYQRYFEGT